MFQNVLMFLIHFCEIYDPDKNNNKNNEWKFKVGDKIIHGKNNKEKDIYNGSIFCFVSDVKVMIQL